MENEVALMRYHFSDTLGSFHKKKFQKNRSSWFEISSYWNLDPMLDPEGNSL
jgi:hypothetical protein